MTAQIQRASRGNNQFIRVQSLTALASCVVGVVDKLDVIVAVNDESTEHEVVDKTSGIQTEILPHDLKQLRRGGAARPV